MKLNSKLKKHFKSALDKYHKSLLAPPLSGKTDFVDRTLASFHNLNISTEDQSLAVNSKKIHLMPKVKYPLQGPLFPNLQTTVELVDILFVYKHLLDGARNAYRGSVVQVKYTKEKKKSWEIAAQQFYLLTGWSIFKFVRPQFENWHLIKPKTRTWAMYGFVGSDATKYPIYYSSTRILRHRNVKPSTGSFKFPVRKEIGWDSSTSFLLKFVQGFIGENLMINMKAKALVKDLYKFAKLKPDPTGEQDWDYDNKKGEGLGIIEFSVSNKQRSG